MGFSINDTIVVFDRVRENFRNLRVEPVELLHRSINQTLSRTNITSVVAFLRALALFLYGRGSLEGMALSQLMGIVIGTHSSLDRKSVVSAQSESVRLIHGCGH